MKYCGQEDGRELIDYKRNRFPYCVVWTPLPLITALFPFIGHTGVCTADGIIHDFSGPYTVTVDNMAFGKPTKYVKLQETSLEWNSRVDDGDRKYREEMHNLFTNNCHSHVAYVLNQAGYQGGGWNMVSVWWLCISRSRYVGFSGFMRTYVGSIIFIGILIAMRYILA